MVGALFIAFLMPGKKLPSKEVLAGFCRAGHYALAGLKELRQTVCDRTVNAGAGCGASSPERPGGLAG
jgi:hypothetical protein